MIQIEFKDLRRSMIIMEECSYGNNTYKVLTDYEIFNGPDYAPGFGGVEVLNLEYNQHDTIGGVPGYEPTIFLISRGE